MYKCLLSFCHCLLSEKLSTEFLQAPAQLNYVVGWVLLQVAGIPSLVKFREL